MALLKAPAIPSSLEGLGILTAFWNPAQASCPLSGVLMSALGPRSHSRHSTRSDKAVSLRTVSAIPAGFRRDQSPDLAVSQVRPPKFTNLFHQLWLVMTMRQTVVGKPFPAHQPPKSGCVAFLGGFCGPSVCKQNTNSDLLHKAE